MSVCPSCNAGYDPETRRPRMLHCGHALCTLCVVQLHRLNNGVIPCPRCGREEYYEDVSQLAIILDLEARVESLSLEEKQKEVVAAEGEESPWDICSLHGGPLSSWCTTCRHAVCPDCGQFHGDLHHQVVDYQRAKELLLSRYEDESQAFLEWLVKVEAATRTTLEAAEAALLPLRQTLSILGSHIGRMRGHAEALEGAASLETLEDLLEKRSRWSKKSRTSAQLQVDAAVSTLGWLESAMATLRCLQREVEDGFARARDPSADAAAGASLPQEEGGDKKQQEAALIATPRLVIKSWDPFTLLPRNAQIISIPDGVGAGGLGRRCTATHLEFKIKTPQSGPNKLCLCYSTGKTCGIFSTCWDLGADRIVMKTKDPTSNREKDAAPPREGCGLRWGALYRARVEADSGKRYEVFLDGNSMGRSYLGTPVATKLELCSMCPVEISKFFIETY